MYSIINGIDHILEFISHPEQSEGSSEAKMDSSYVICVTQNDTIDYTQYFLLS